MHYERLRKYGTPLIELPFRKPPIQTPCLDNCSCKRHSNPGGYRTGKDHPNWKGDDVSVKAFHVRLGKASDHKCIDCDKQAEDWSRKTNADPLKIESYEPRCKLCHYRYDSELHRQKALKQWEVGNIGYYPEKRGDLNDTV